MRALALIFAVPFVVVGMLLCATVVLIPLGVAVMGLGVQPFVQLHMKRIREDVAKQQAAVVANKAEAREAKARARDTYEQFIAEQEIPWTE